MFNRICTEGFADNTINVPSQVPPHNLSICLSISSLTLRIDGPISLQALSNLQVIHYILKTLNNEGRVSNRPIVSYMMAEFDFKVNNIIQ